MVPGKNCGGGLSALLVMGVLCCLAEAQQPRSEQQEAFEPRDDRLVDIHNPHLRVSPGLGLQERYDSNIFLTDGDETEDWVFIVAPSMDVEYQSDRFVAKVSYLLQHLEFNDHTEQTGEQHFLDGGWRLKLKKVYVGMDGSFQQTQDPLDIVLAERLEIERDSLMGVAGIDLDRLSVEVRGGRRNFDIHNDLFNLLDYDQQEVGASILWKLNDAWRLVAAALGGWTDYNEDVKNDYTYEEGTVGVQWAPSEQFGLRADVGYRHEEFDPDSGTSPTLTEDYEDPVARLTLLWKPCDQGQATLAYDHRPEESVTTNFVTQDRVILAYQHHLGSRWTARVNGSYQRAEESQGGMPQDVKENYGAGAGLTFNPLKWVSIDAVYRFSSKDTNDDTGEYDDHQGTIGMTVRF